MKKYVIDITRRATENMDGIYNYISHRLEAPETALRQYNRIVSAILSLEEMPERIGMIKSADKTGKAYRRLIVDNYSVFFVVEEDCVVVMDVLYNASDIESKLDELRWF